VRARAELRAVLNSQIAVELRSLLPKTPSQAPTNLAHLPPPRPLPSGSGSLLAEELARVESKRPLRAGEQGLDTTRYAMPFPSEDDLDDVDAWERAYKSSLAQLEHQRLRTVNGTLLQQLGANKWRVENFALENAIQRVENEATESKEVVEGVNRRRKADQEKAGETLARLERRWQELVSGNMQLEIGCFALYVTPALSVRSACPAQMHSMLTSFGTLRSEEELAVLQARHGELQQRLQATQ
jgi:pre-mRNA-splicing factor SPF27